MKLIDNWKAVATQAWSMRFMYAATALGALELALPALDGLLPPRTFAIATVAVTALALIARLVSQPTIHPEPKP